MIETATDSGSGATPCEQQKLSAQSLMKNVGPRNPRGWAGVEGRTVIRSLVVVVS